MGAIEQDAECSYEKDLCKRFVEQARLNGDPVHYGRAMAMQAEILGRLGNFEEALEVVEQIKAMYDIDKQHAAICKAYGSDRVAQALSYSVNFNSMLGNTQAALDTCHYILEEIVPKSDPRNIHNMFCLLYAVLIFLKENGLPLKAREIFQARVVQPFEEHFGDSGRTYSRPMFEPILAMLELQGNEDQEIEKINEYVVWALEEEKFEQKLKSFETVWAAFSASPYAILGEICFSLAKRRECIESRDKLLQKAITLMEQSVASTENMPYSNTYAKKQLARMKTFQNGLSDGDAEYSKWISSYGTMEESSLSYAPWFLYTGADGEAVPTDVSHLRVHPSVTAIPAEAFQGRRQLQYVYLPEGLQTIMEKAFFGCDSLGQIKMPSTLNFIGDSAFYNTRLTSIDLPDGMESIGEKVFRYCEPLNNVRIPPLISEVPREAFRSCVGMFSLELPEGAKICNGALVHCCSLRNIAPSEVFHGCDDLLEVFSPYDTQMKDALMHRFDGLPIHKLIYYQSYHPEEETIYRLSGALNQSFNQQDSLGMTPLHILACSKKQRLKLYQMLIENHPENLITKDKWGGLPLLYAVWGRAPVGIIQFLVDSHKLNFPHHELNWETMVKTLAMTSAPFKVLRESG